MKSILVGYIFLFIFCFTGYTQDLEIEWEKRLTSKNIDFFTDLIEDKNGGFSAIGTIKPEGRLDQEFWLVRFDITGELLWSKTFGTINNECPKSFAQFADGSYVLAGKTISPENVMQSILIKLDNQGNEIWQKVLENEKINVLESVVVLDNNNFIVGGNIKNEDIENIWLAKLSSEGDLIWEKTYGDKLSVKLESMRKLADGSVVLAARLSQNGIQDLDLWLLKFNDEGEKIWENHIESPGVSVWPECICCSPDKNIIVAGWYGSCMNEITSENPIFDYDLYLTKITPDGKVVWSKNIDSEGSEGGSAIAVRPDGNILVAGKKETSFLGRVGTWILLTDQEGNLMKELVIPNNFNKDNVASIINSSDGGFAIVGPGEINQRNQVGDAWIKKFKAF